MFALADGEPANVTPELVVIVGGVTAMLDLIGGPLRAQLPSFLKEAPRVEASPLGDTGVVVGPLRRGPRGEVMRGSLASSASALK